MKVYSIKDLESLSGIKAHTIRMWEKRYGVLNPERNESNIRYYSDGDLRTLMNIAFLVKRNHKISKIAELTVEQLSIEVYKITELEKESNNSLDALTLSMIQMDGTKFEQLIKEKIDELGFERMVLEVANPFVEKMHALAASGCIKKIQEGFIVQLIKRNIYSILGSYRFPSIDNPPKVLAFLPGNEKSEPSLLFAQYLFSKRGFNVQNIGSNISYTDAIQAYEILDPKIIFCVVNDGNVLCPTQDYINKLSRHLRNCTLIVVGDYAYKNLTDPPENVKVFLNLNEAFQHVDRVHS